MTVVRNLSLVIVFVASLPGTAAAQGIVAGTVRAASTGEPLVHVRVSVAGLGLAQATDASGRYEIATVPAGAHAVHFGLVGFRAEVREVVVASGEVARIDVLMTEAAIALEGFVAVGSRAEPRTVTQSPVPVDAIPAAEIAHQGDTDLSNLLRNVAPSYNVNTQPIADAATISRPANLRNLAPDHTLVLVNGKRRHRAAAIAWFGNGVADGAQGPDIAVVPAIALRQIEILRDGASAQYGSDAIAGVMNFELKNSRSGGSVEVRTGAYPLGGGDGDAHTLAANAGLPLGELGFANLSVEYGASNPTSRSVQRSDALHLISSGNSAVATPAQVWGSPKVEDDLKLWANFGAFLSERMQFYGHGNFASKRVTGGFYFRNPNSRQAIFSNDEGRTLLVGDLLDASDGILDGSANCPVVRITGGVPDPVALQQVKENPNCFTFQERFPGGYTPQFGADYLDASVVAGLKGETGGFRWDASASVGRNTLDFFIHETTNASLGPNTPTSFDLGAYRQQELNLHADLSYAVNKMVNVAGGGEWRNEEFEIGMGQRESWEIGPLATQGFRAASDGFPGFGPIAVGSWDRGNVALYGDVELRDPDDGRWTLGGAVRFENFDGFGAAVNGKLAGRYGFTDALALRGSVSTGFRAPTPGQQNAFNVTTEFDRELNAPVNKATIASTSEVAKLRGGKALDPETSLNVALGAVIGWNQVAFTVDYFRIAVASRISLTQDFRLTAAEVQRLLAEGISSAGDVRDFRFFTNDFDTRTQGVDVVATYEPEAMAGATTFTLLFNHTDTEVTAYSPDVLDDRRILELRRALPRNRWNLSVAHASAPWRFLARLNYFGGWYDSEDVRFNDGGTTVDLEAAYSLAKSASFTFGAQNALNKFPGVNPNAAQVGNPYSQFSPYGFNGAFFYARFNYQWSWDSSDR